ncbi:MAG: hypothetical protein B6I20_03130 [Bacteroidetes bacterium 4572_117]|nr:MAG: hypothetical protein B6I20_03130 [Bacteroidetes bacterium 4572_117]
MLLVLYFVLLLLSFYLLAKVCDDYFVESLDGIAQKLKLSSDVAGATFMAVGSSAPELFVAIIAVVKPGNHEQIGMGTIVGSAIFNLLIIAGVVGLIKQFNIKWHIVLRDLLFYLVGVLFLYFVFIDGNITLLEGVLFPFLYVIYVFLVMKWKKWVPFIPEEKEVQEKEVETKNRSHFFLWLVYVVKPLDFLVDKFFVYKKNVFFVFFGSIMLIGFFSWTLVESAIGISKIMDIPEAFIALTVLAIGTSVPDMLSSMVVARQNRGGMAVTNAIASNIFDILIGLGIPFLILIYINGTTVAINTSGLVDSTLLLILSIVGILALLVINKWNIGKKMGISLILFYIFFLVYKLVFTG